MHSFVFDVVFCHLCSFLEFWVTPHQRLEACRSMPQGAAACRSTAKFSGGPLVPTRLPATVKGAHDMSLKMFSL